MPRIGLLGVSLLLAACGADPSSEGAGNSDEMMRAQSEAEPPADKVATDEALPDANLIEPTIALPATPLDSVSTLLEFDKCRITERLEEGESISWRCPGYKGVPLFVHAGDGRYDINAGVDSDSNWASLLAFNEPDRRVEWRLLNGEPHAIIYRLHDVSGMSGKRSVLFVEAIGTEGQPGCVVARIDGSTPEANEVARRYAIDLLETISCKGHETIEVGNAA